MKQDPTHIAYTRIRVKEYNSHPVQTVQGKNRSIACFEKGSPEENIDKQVVAAFGEEWTKFNDFTDLDINETAREYFDILNEKILHKEAYVLDAGCGTGRWSRYIAGKVGFVEAIDPSNAIFAADKLLASVQNVRLTKASIDHIPFDDESFDLVMSIGVLHHIPDTQQAINDCVRKVKRGGYFYAYIYYNLDNRGYFYRILFSMINLIRMVVSRFPSGLRRWVCDVMAVCMYMPWVLLGRLFQRAGAREWAKRIPLSYYQNKSFYIIRNDALDRFGTKLEQRFSKKQMITMLEKAGLTNIVVSPGLPYWHMVAQRQK